MRRYLFIGGIEGNTGPDNVNKGIVSNLPICNIRQSIGCYNWRFLGE